MFRDTSGVKMNDEYFGVGSVILLGPNASYVLIADNDSKHVRFLDLITFQLVGTQWKIVGDINYLSEKETRDLFDNAFPDYTFSDGSLHPKGIKHIQIDYINKNMRY